MEKHEFTALSPDAQKALDDAMAKIRAALGSRQAFAFIATLLPELEVMVESMTPKNPATQFLEKAAFSYVAHELAALAGTPISPNPSA